MTETVMQRFIQEKRTAIAEVYESRRPMIFDTNGNVTKEMVMDRLRAYVEETIGNSTEVDKNSQFIGKDTIVLRMPEDSHLIPLMEPMIFEELKKYKVGSDKTAPISLRALMLMDPQVNDLKEGNLKGESFFMHELRHYLGSDETSTTPTLGIGGTVVDRTNDYIAIKFFIKDGQLQYTGFFIPDETTISGRMGDIDGDLEPQHPHMNDVIRATRTYTSYPVSILSKLTAWIEATKIISGKSEKMVDQWNMGNRLLNPWKEMHPEINPKDYT